MQQRRRRRRRRWRRGGPCRWRATRSRGRSRSAPTEPSVRSRPTFCDRTSAPFPSPRVCVCPVRVYSTAQP
jgi:hypothetical protein